jgi:hypothetical protein
MLTHRDLTHKYIEKPGTPFPGDKLAKAIETNQVEQVKNMLANLDQQELSQVINYGPYLVSKSC